MTVSPQLSPPVLRPREGDVRLPPGPDGAQHLAQMRMDPLRFVSDLQERYGDITCHTTGGDTVLMLNRADLARYVLKDNGANYTKKGTPDDYMLRPLLGNGLLTSTGAEWARQRRMCAPAFRPSEVRTFDGIITDAAQAMLRRWQPAIDSGAPIAMDHQLTALTLSIVVGAILSVDVDGIGEGFGRAVDAVNGFIGHFSAADHSSGSNGIKSGTKARDTYRVDASQGRREFNQAKRFLDVVTRTLIESRRVSGSHPADLLSAMTSSDHAISDGDLQDQVLTLIMAGHETTAKSLTWALYLLDRHPDKAAKVYDEVDRVLGGRTPTAADMPDLLETQHALKEAMRLYPPIWLISRRAVEDDQIEGYDVPAGTLVCLSQWVLHRDERYWDRPAEFLPDRFNDPRHPSHAYLPFGGGDRICIGQHFAMIEATLALATILQQVRPALVPGFSVEPEALVTLRPKHGMSMVAVRR